MRRIALLIGNSNGLEGVKKDLSDWIKFLTSAVGGAWKKEEILLKMNPSKVDLLNYIHSIRNTYDFAIVVYSGHGGYDKKTVLEINQKEETINETDLLYIAPKQISVFDCCRSLVDKREPLNDSQRTFSTGGVISSIQRIRAAYEQRIQQAIEQQICLYACRIDETALDTEHGALYIQQLLFCAKTVSQDKVFNSVEIVHRKASLFTSFCASKRNHQQHPSAILPKCLSCQKLILSINPNKI